MPVTKTYSARIDSNSANNPALNLTGDPAFSLTFVNETLAGDPGDLFLEGDTDAGIADPDTVVQIGGVTYEFSLTLTGTMPTSNSDGANQVPAEFRGSDVYLVTVYDYPAPGDTTRVAFMPNETATLADMDNIGNGRISINNLNTNPPPGPICFAEGTLIEAPDGPRKVETLRPGEVVLTADHGPQPIWWIGNTHFDWGPEPHHNKPIQIKTGSLGHNLPSNDLIVSPQHRIALRDPAGREVMAPAKALTRFPGIRQMCGKRQVRYFHLLLPRHSMIFAHGIGTESLFPGEMALAAMSMQARREVYSVLRMQNLSVADYGPGARPFRTVGALRGWSTACAVGGPADNRQITAA